MKIVLIGPYPLKNEINSGVDMHINKLSNYLSNINDLEVHVITLGSSYSKIKKDNLDITILKWSHILPLDIIRLRNEIRNINPSIIHCQGTYFPYSVVAALLSNEYKTLLTVHGFIDIEMHYLTGIHYLIAKFIAKPLEDYTLSKIENIIVCSPDMKELLLHKGNFEINIIPNGIDSCEKNKYDLYNLKNPSILFLGVLEKRKGIDILIRSIHLLVNSIPNIHLYIAGEGTQDANLKKLTRNLGLKNNITFVGQLSNNKKYSFYNSTDIFVLPSLFEPFGIVLLEAMALGKPVIASNVGGIPSIIKDKKNGILFKSGNADDLANKIAFLIKNRDLMQKIGFEGFKTAKSYNWENIAKKTSEVYKKIIFNN